MNPLKRSFISVILLSAWMGCGLLIETQAQVAYEVRTDAGEVLDVRIQNQPRGASSLVLYTPSYGSTTRTNPHGVEAIFEPVQNPSNPFSSPVPTANNGAGNDPGRYKIRSVSSVWDCSLPKQAAPNQGKSDQANLGQSKEHVQLCGDATIPYSGWVLSASDEWRQRLLNFVASGTEFTLKPLWFQSSSQSVAAINPNEANNPGVCAFPGCRGGNQLVIYDTNAGRQNTDTNEFGYEVTVVGGTVVRQEGANSEIPANGFVVSGHGSKKTWLITNAPLGAKITFSEDGKSLTSSITPETYRYQLMERYELIQANLNELRKAGALSPQASLSAELLPNLFNQSLESMTQAMAKNQPDEAAQIATHTLEKLNETLWTLYPQYPVGSLQGVWHRPVETSSVAIGKTLDALQAAGINAVFLETYFHGYTIFPSDTFKKYGLPIQNPKLSVGGDLLNTWLTEAHKRNMQVHIWFETFYAGNKQAYQAPQPEVGPILAKYPQWANIQLSGMTKSKLQPSTLEAGGYFLDPANPEVQKFLLSLIDEIVTRYPIDGFQLDYIRYPSSFPPERFSYLATTWGYTPVAREKFKAESSFDPADFTKSGINEDQQDQWTAWNQFKTNQVTQFVDKATHLIQARRPLVQRSVAVFPGITEALSRKHQDWMTWGKNGWVDFMAPMTLTSATKAVKENTERLRNETDGRILVRSGVFGPFNHNSAEDLLAQIEAARQGGANGFILFDSAHLTRRMTEALSAAHKK